MVMGRLRVWRGKGAFARASEAAAEGEMVCGCYLPSGEPAYFTMPKDAADGEIQARSFEIRNGRPASDSELWLAEQIKRRLPAPAVA